MRSRARENLQLATHDVTPADLMHESQQSLSCECMSTGLAGQLVRVCSCRWYGYLLLSYNILKRASGE
jgi:hypothetical protein